MHLCWTFQLKIIIQYVFCDWFIYEHSIFKFHSYCSIFYDFFPYYWIILQYMNILQFFIYICYVSTFLAATNIKNIHVQDYLWIYAFILLSTYKWNSWGSYGKFMFNILRNFLWMSAKGIRDFHREFIESIEHFGEPCNFNNLSLFLMPILMYLFMIGCAGSSFLLQGFL